MTVVCITTLMNLMTIFWDSNDDPLLRKSIIFAFLIHIFEIRLEIILFGVSITNNIDTMPPHITKTHDTVYDISCYKF